MDLSAAKNFNERLKYYRRSLGLTQQQFADAMSMTRSNYAHLESEGKPSPEMLIKLSAVLKISVDDLLGNTPPTDRHTAESHAAEISGVTLRSVNVFENQFDKFIDVVLSPPSDFIELDAVEREIIVNYRIMDEEDRSKFRSMILKFKNGANKN